jgi:DNA-binding protein
MTYVHATLTQIASQPIVTIKARGKKITQAVDVSQMIVKRMDAVGYYIKQVRLASDSLISEDGRPRNVSTIEIDIAKN